MKNIYIILISICFMLSTFDISSSVIEENQYIKLNPPIHNAPNLLEFFSFYCSHCYQFEHIYKISDAIRQKLPKNITFYKYHINYLGNLGKQLTHAWAVAIFLGVENQISPVLFMAIQKQQSLHTTEDIRNKFIQSGVNADEYDTAWNSVTVKSLILDQEKAAINFSLKSVPAIFINGKYMIKNDKLDFSSINSYIEQFSNLLNLLIEKT